MRVAEEPELPHGDANAHGQRGQERMSRLPNDASEEALDLERLVIDADYRQEVMLRLKAESLARRARRTAERAGKPPTRKD
jgi:hypothetical protein